MPPLPTDAARAPGQSSSSWSTSTTSSMSDASASGARIGGQQAGGVGEQDEELGRDQVGHQSGQPVVVAEADLVVGDGVVLVHDGHHAQLEQRRQGLAGMEVLLAVDEVERGQQDLARRDARRSSNASSVGAHQLGLAHRRDRLQDGRVGGALVRPPRADQPAAIAPS